MLCCVACVEADGGMRQMATKECSEGGLGVELLDQKPGLSGGSLRPTLPARCLSWLGGACKGNLR